MTSLFSVFTDVMLWGTIPLFGGLGYWEQHMLLSESNRVFLQLILLVVVTGWAGFWYSTGENYRLAHRPIAKPENPRAAAPIEGLRFGMDEPSLQENTAESWKLNEEAMDHKKVRKYVSNH